MTGKIFKSIFAASVSVLLAALIVIIGVLYAYFTDLENSRLKSQLRFAAQGVVNEGVSYLYGLSERDFRLTLVGADGKVIYDTDADESAMENHAEREEIKEALKTGSGESSRVSNTLLEKTMYIANRLPDGSVLRISTTHRSVIMLVIGIIYPIVLILIFAVFISVVMSKRMAKKIVEPLNLLNLENPLENEAYDEISPLLTHMEQQNRKIQAQIAELKRSQSEFSAIIHNMKEGLVLLGKTGKILAINNAAAEFFGTNTDCVGKDFLTVERNRDIDAAVRDAVQNGRSEILISRNGGEYQLNVSRIGENDVADGVAILTFDITERVFAERNRREFTANVSHELKTPIHSIMGSAELIKNGLVKSEDMPRFAETIYSEAERLSILVNDVIRLSQLDEKTDMTFENVDILEAAKESAHRLESAAKEKNITISVTGDSAVIYAVPRLVYEIVFNLCENAVKYNIENGKVDISISACQSGARLVVSDTGIGISAEYQNRVFERFFRVDKSLSRETGGTGLGLSIVKHAAEYLGAEVSLKSEKGKGSVFTVIFSK